MDTSRITLPFALAAILSSTAAAAPSIIYVDEHATGPVHDGTTWCTAFKTLYQGIAASTAGDTVRVAGGLYTPDASLLPDPRLGTFTLKDGVRIEGAYAGCGAPNPDARDPANDTSFIRGDPLRDDDITGDVSNNSYHVITANAVSATTVLDGLYIDGGRAANPLVVDALNGAGMLCINASPTVVNCIFQGNEAQSSSSGLDGRGGSVYARGSKPHFTGCLFRESIAGERGGGVYSERSSILYDDCFFAACITNGLGGGAYNDERSYAYVFDSRFLVCSANDGQGGGLYNYGATVLVARSSFQSSYAHDGAGVYDRKAHVDFVNCSFWSYNHASNDGGCIYGDGSPTTLMNCLLGDNQAVNLGGGIVHHDAKLAVTNCTIAQNTAGAGAAGIELFGAGGATVTNTILWKNSTAGTINESTQIRAALGTPLNLNYSDVTGLTGGLGGVGNIGLDPLFVASGSGDFRLGLGSPCRNAGSNAAIPSDIADLDGDGNLLEPTPLDLDLNLRVQSLIVDMGAYESP
jgi:hypothetical protein